MDQAAGTRVIIIGWKSADWDRITPLLDAGDLPNLARLVEEGVAGRLVTGGPLWGGMIFNSLATGKWPDKHGVVGDLDIAANGSIRSADSSSRRAKAFWEILSQDDRRCHVVNFPATGPAEEIDGVFATPELFRHVRKSSQRLPELPLDQISPAEAGEQLADRIVGLDEIDSETMATFVPGFRQLPRGDKRLTDIAIALAQTRSVHAVAARLADQDDWDVLSLALPLIDVLSRRFGQYQDPPAWVDPKDAAIFGHVVHAALRFCDRLLGRMIRAADDRTVILLHSVRSLLPNELRHPPSAGAASSPEAVYHGYGVFALWGAGIRQDELIHDVQHVDVCPTVLQLVGVAAGEDMDGRVLTDAFVDDAEPLEPIPSWEDIPPLRPEAGLPLDHWLEIGGLSTPWAESVARGVAGRSAWDLARSLLIAGRGPEGLSLLTRQYWTNPLLTGRSRLMAATLMSEGMPGEALEVMAPIAEAFPDAPTGQFMGGMVAMFNGDTYRALDLFEAAGQTNPPFPQLYYYLGQAYLMTDQPARAIDAYTKSISLAGSFMPAYVGLADAYFRAGDYGQSAAAAGKAVSLRFTLPLCHILLGRALAKAGEDGRAKEAFEQALQLNPNDSRARRALAALSDGDAVELDIPPDAGGEEQSPAGARPRHEASQEAVREARRSVARWQSDVTDAIGAADGRLDDYLAANAKTRGVSPPPPPLSDPTEGMEWVVRPALASDQPVIARMFPDAFTRGDDLSFYLIHPAGTDDVQGGVMMRPKQGGSRIVLTLAVRGPAGSEPDDTARWLMWRLLRAGVVRAAAGGARLVTLTIASTEDKAVLRGCLAQLGFALAYSETTHRMSTEALRDRYLPLAERYHDDEVARDDLRMVELTPALYAGVDGFLREFFPDGAGEPLDKFSSSLSRVILKGGDVIACYVGRQSDADPEVFDVSRLAVRSDVRSQWITAWLLGEGTKVVLSRGYPTVDFCTDEARYPGFIKIARRVGAVQTGVVDTMTLPLVAPWPGA